MGSNIDGNSTPSIREFNPGDVRKFNPVEIYGEGINLSEVETPHHNDPWVLLARLDADPCMHCGKRPGRFTELVIATTGKCRDEGTDQAKAGVGVYFGKDSQLNCSTLVGNCLPTSEIAEVTAGILAIQVVLFIQRSVYTDDDPLKKVVIKTDSEYLFKGVTEDVFNWNRTNDGFVEADGTPVNNSKLFELIDMNINELAERGAETLFWLVPSASNQAAESLATRALDEDKL